MNSRPLILAAALLSTAAFAGQPVVRDSKDVKDAKKIVMEPCEPDTLTYYSLRSSYTGDSDFKRGDNSHGDSFSKEIEVNHRFLLGEGWPNAACGHWYARVGADYSRWDFDNGGTAPLPNVLQSFNLNLALEYVVNDGAAFTLETRPGFYFEHNVDLNDFDIPTYLYTAFWHKTTDSYSVTLLAGVSYAGFRSYQFIPFGGIVVTSGKWTLRAVPPEPRLTYQATDKLNLWVGGELAGGSFRTDGHGYRRKSQLDDAVLSYSEYRAEAGFSYKCHGLIVDLGAGYAFDRKFDYHRADRGYETNEGAPFAKIEIRGGF